MFILYCFIILWLNFLVCGEASTSVPISALLNLDWHQTNSQINMSTDIKTKRQNLTKKSTYICIWCTHWTMARPQHLCNLSSCSPRFGLTSLRSNHCWRIIEIWATIWLGPSPEPITCTNWPRIRSIPFNWSFRVHWW